MGAYYGQPFVYRYFCPPQPNAVTQTPDTSLVVPDVARKDVSGYSLTAKTQTRDVGHLSRCMNRSGAKGLSKRPLKKLYFFIQFY